MVAQPGVVSHTLFTDERVIPVVGVVCVTESSMGVLELEEFVASQNGQSTPIHDDVVCAILHDHNVPVFIPSLSSPDQPSSSTHALLLVEETPTHALPLDNQISVQVSMQVIDQMTTEGRRIPTASLSPVITDLSRTTQSSLSSPSPKSNMPASPPAGIAAGRTAVSCSSSPGDLYLHRSSTPFPPQVCCCFQAATRSDLAFSSPVSHSSILAPAAEGEGSTKASLSMELDASHSPLVIHEDITAVTDIPPSLPSQSPVADIVIDSSSTHSLGTEHIVNCPLDPPHVGHESQKAHVLVSVGAM